MLRILTLLFLTAAAAAWFALPEPPRTPAGHGEAQMVVRTHLCLGSGVGCGGSR